MLTNSNCLANRIEIIRTCELEINKTPQVTTKPPGYNSHAHRESARCVVPLSSKHVDVAMNACRSRFLPGSKPVPMHDIWSHSLDNGDLTVDKIAAGVCSIFYCSTKYTFDKGILFLARRSIPSLLCEMVDCMVCLLVFKFWVRLHQAKFGLLQLLEAVLTRRIWAFNFRLILHDEAHKWIVSQH